MILILIFLAINNIEIFLYLGTIVFLFIIIFFKFTKNKSIHVGKSIDEETNAQFKLINESFDGFSELRISNIADKYFFYIKSKALSIAKFKIIREVLSTLPRDFFQFLAVFIIASLILIFSSLDKDLNDILPYIAMLAVSLTRVIPAVNFISYSLVRISSSQNAIRLLSNELVKFKFQDDLKSEGKIDFINLNLINISFKYPSNNGFTLNKINISINQGDKVAIKGKSGAGKTTLLNIILGLLIPTRGNMLINSKNIKNKIRLRKWHNDIAYISQNNFIVDDTILYNITFENNTRNINTYLLEESLKFSGLDLVCKKLNKGIDTIIGERGIQLSGGQKQRVALARAFYSERKIFILDEATNALDKQSEIKILQKLFNEKITLFLVSHKSEHFKYCNKSITVK